MSQNLLGVLMGIRVLARVRPERALLEGVVAQTVYVGQGYRYRVRTDGADIWVHAPERVAEGTATCVVVPRDALLLFPKSP